MGVGVGAAAGLAAVLGELLELGDLALAFEPGRVPGRKRLDQAFDPVADLQREVGRGRAGESANVLGGQLGRAVPAARGSPSRSSFASDLRKLGEAVDFGLLAHFDRLLVSDHPDVVVEGARRVFRVARLDVEQVVRSAAGSVSASSVSSSGPQVPEAESGETAAATTGSSSRAITNPCPGSLTFQPKSPSE